MPDAAPSAGSESPPRPHAPSGGRHALLVGAGIFLSRVAGLVRERVFAYYLGNGDAADVFRVALRIPNLLQNLFGEGVLSASFIPVYASLRAAGDDAEARRVAGAVFSLLTLVTAAIVLLGIGAAPLLVDVLSPGFEGAKREATIHAVRILYPGVGFLVLSAWCLGVLNSHRRFFLSYAAPVVWNALIAGALVAGGRAGGAGYELAYATAWGAFAGSAAQLLVQLPAAWTLAGGVRARLALASAHVREVLRNFGPVVVGRGVVQVSAYVDSVIASLLPAGSVAALGYAQVLYTLPVSLFGMAVSASELPEMSSASGDASRMAAHLRSRLEPALRRIALFIVPSAAAFFAFGDVMAALLFQNGRFTSADANHVWAILAGSAVGLLAATLGRLHASAFYALRDTRTPLRCAVVRVLLATGLGVILAIPAPPLLGLDPRWGVAGITIASGAAAWIELLLLRRGLEARIGTAALPAPYLLRLWSSALAGVAAGWAVKLATPGLQPLLRGPAVLGPYGSTYFLVAMALGVPEARALVRSLLRRAHLLR